MEGLKLGDIATWVSSGVALIALIVAIASIRNAGRANRLAESANKISEEASRRGKEVELRQIERVDVRWLGTIDNQGYMVFKNVGLDVAKDIRIEAKIFLNSDKADFIPFQAVEEKDSDPRISGSWLAIRGTKSVLRPNEILGIPTAPGTPFDFSGFHGEDRCWGLSASIWWSTKLDAPRHSKLFEQMLTVSCVADEFPPFMEGIARFLKPGESLAHAISPIRSADEIRGSIQAATSALTLIEIERAEAEARQS
ncbi:hypothetical protein [Cryobacterium arcticum]|uniref:hypothetical protein n=1 Tax=Cryobacterium arcticum TaxID=670052 RepID=UPI0011B5A436|nr:hypothetical protein [Cryobacterium arcticum]